MKATNNKSVLIASLVLLVTITTGQSSGESLFKSLADQYKSQKGILGGIASLYNSFDMLSNGDGV